MTRFAALSLLTTLVFLSFSAREGAAEPRDGVPLYQAVREGEVRVTVLQTRGHGKVLMRIVNCTPSRRRVRLPGTYLQPRSGGYQRLALGYSERTRTPTVSVPSVGQWKGWVTSCCMDHGKSSPSERTPYAVKRKKAPLEITAIMEHWSANTGLKQNLVNEYVWGQKKGPLPKAPGKAPEKATEPGFDMDGVRLYAWGGRLLALCTSGELLRLRHDEKWECLGEGIEVAGVGWGRIVARFGREEVKEYNETSRTWVPRGTLHGVESFLPGARHTYALLGNTLFTFQNNEIWVQAKRGVAGASLSKDLEGRHIFAVGTRSAGSGIKRSSGDGTAWVSSRRKGFRDVFATATTVYGLDRRGLVKISKEGYRRLRGPGSFFPHRGGVVRVDSEGTFERYMEAGGYWTNLGRPGAVTAVSVDPVDGTIYSHKSDGKVVILEAGGTWKDGTKIATRKEDLVNGNTAVVKPESGGDKAAEADEAGEK
ncbi:MAG: hypothetical protein ACYTFG_18345 [Planctomycetota bacterium]